MSAMYAGVTPSLPSCNPNASQIDARPVQLTQTNGHVTQTDKHVDNPADTDFLDLSFWDFFCVVLSQCYANIGLYGLYGMC